LPKEFSEEEIDDFIKLSKEATECRVRRIGDVVKLKLRTSRYLYTLKLKPDKAEDIVKNLGCTVVEG
jgi:hypothetical protein